MANIQLIIDNLQIIVDAGYKGKASSRKTMHELAFDKLQGSAEQIVSILTQNPNPNRDTTENLQTQFDAMQKNIKAYCSNTAETEDVLRAFNPLPSTQLIQYSRLR